MTLKLTPQKAAELLKELRYAKVQMGGQLSIRDEYFKQALEHALLVIQTQETADVFGVGFLVCRPCVKPEEADPRKVTISFTDAGLGYEVTK